MRHLILTLLITLSFLTSRHHITHSDDYILYDIYDDNLIQIGVFESVYFSGKEIGCIFKKHDANRRFRTFFEEEIYNQIVDIYNPSALFNNYIKITEAFKALPQDSIDKIPPYGIIVCYFDEPEDNPADLIEYFNDLEEQETDSDTEIIL